MQWEFEYRPRRSVLHAVIAAVVVLAIHLIFAALLTISFTGSPVGGTDQAALALIGVILAGLILLLTRPRLRAGPEGVQVRNVLGDRTIEWDLVQTLWYPKKGMCARLELPGDEHIPVLAVRANDGDRAVTAMARFRELHEKYS